ncbi:uncharacterized protein LOC144167726 [Haemaphysalis longicornis]
MVAVNKAGRRLCGAAPSPAGGWPRSPLILKPSGQPKGSQCAPEPFRKPSTRAVLLPSAAAPKPTAATMRGATIPVLGVLLLLCSRGAHVLAGDPSQGSAGGGAPSAGGGHASGGPVYKLAQELAPGAPSGQVAKVPASVLAGGQGGHHGGAPAHVPVHGPAGAPAPGGLPGLSYGANGFPVNAAAFPAAGGHGLPPGYGFQLGGLGGAGGAPASAYGGGQSAHPYAGAGGPQQLFAGPPPSYGAQQGYAGQQAFPAQQAYAGPQAFAGPQAYAGNGAATGAFAPQFAGHVGAGQGGAGPQALGLAGPSYGGHLSAPGAGYAGVGAPSAGGPGGATAQGYALPQGGHTAGGSSGVSFPAGAYLGPAGAQFVSAGGHTAGPALAAGLVRGPPVLQYGGGVGGAAGQYPLGQGGHQAGVPAQALTYGGFPYGGQGAPYGGAGAASGAGATAVYGYANPAVAAPLQQGFQGHQGHAAAYQPAQAAYGGPAVSSGAPSSAAQAGLGVSYGHGKPKSS